MLVVKDLLSMLVDLNFAGLQYEGNLLGVFRTELGTAWLDFGMKSFMLTEWPL